MARGHKSTKIPGVRLRPAPAQDSSRSDAQAARSSKRKHAGGACLLPDLEGVRVVWQPVLIHSVPAASHSDDEADEHEDVGVEAMNTVSRPFKGAVVCFTGVQDKVGRRAWPPEWSLPHAH